MTAAPAFWTQLPSCLPLGGCPRSRDCGNRSSISPSQGLGAEPDVPAGCGLRGMETVPLTAHRDHLFTAPAPASRPRAAESEGRGVEGRLPLSFLETSPGNPSSSNLQPHTGVRKGREGWNRRGFESQPCLFLAAATQLRPNSSEPHCSRLEDGDADVHPRTTGRRGQRARPAAREGGAASKRPRRRCPHRTDAEMVPFLHLLSSLLLAKELGGSVFPTPESGLAS